MTAGRASVDGQLVVDVDRQAYDLTVYEAASGRKIGTVPVGIGTEASCPASMTETNGVPRKLLSHPTLAQETAALRPFTG
ncbi:hypothetical protein OG455_01145 [Kitasatospora sp. NBC_01287]|uniref:hypothetical protein n=1 Tax=Kitasatospora sp. NBC_01287 TaxID=2903573 RepID=UPI002252E2CB|nr:hypothetical protein [Kitasatospora sp. NBC_01287]MCX4744130.1 hypothetical protein [Kitasatospora sp. NBC_01287]